MQRSILLAKGIPNPGCFNPSVTGGNAKRQRGILAAALQCLAPGGYLLYTTCTYAPEENERNVLYLLKRCPDLRTAARAGAGAFPFRPDAGGLLPTHAFSRRGRGRLHLPAAPGGRACAPASPAGRIEGLAHPCHEPTNTMKIGVFSDMHDRTDHLELAMRQMRLLDCGHFMFLGDCTTPESFQRLIELTWGLPLDAVPGNNDYELAIMRQLAACSPAARLHRNTSCSPGTA